MTCDYCGALTRYAVPLHDSQYPTTPVAWWCLVCIHDIGSEDGDA